MRVGTDYDFVIIGAGAAGLIAARFAARLGARVLLVERDRIGGDCTWTGCVPSKSLIRVAKAAHEVRSAQRFGLQAASCTVDMSRVREYVQRKVQEIYEPTSPEPGSPTPREGSPLTTDCERTCRTSTQLATSWGASSSRTWLGGRHSRLRGTRYCRAAPPAASTRWRGSRSPTRKSRKSG